jgi:hypothetical protein
LNELSGENALALLRALGPRVVASHSESRELINELEGLPLTIQVAGQMLNFEASYGFGAGNIIQELREGAKMILAKTPADRTDLTNETTLTVAALMQCSPDQLDSFTRDCFAYLGAFVPSPQPLTKRR